MNRSKNAVCACIASKDGAPEMNEFCRRDFFLFGVSSSFIMSFPTSGSYVFILVSIAIPQ